MRYKKQIYYGSIIIIGLMLSAYLISKYLNSWEKQIGLVRVYTDKIKENSSKEIYQFVFTQGKTQIEFFDDYQYEIYIYKNKEQYLYSKGVWSVEDGLSYFGHDAYLLLRSNLLSSQYARFRFYNYKLRGKFIDAKNEAVESSYEFSKHKNLTETFKFAVTGGHYIIGQYNKVVYNLHEIVEPGLNLSR